jgi:Sec7-like guanine-nucleotide exchange factor
MKTIPHYLLRAVCSIVGPLQIHILTALYIDTVYVLAFGLLMLHTDAHNPNLKKEQKMSAQQFIHNLRGIDDGADLPTEYLARLYDGIGA